MLEWIIGLLRLLGEIIAEETFLKRHSYKTPPLFQRPHPPALAYGKVSLADYMKATIIRGQYLSDLRSVIDSEAYRDSPESTRRGIVWWKQACEQTDPAYWLACEGCGSLNITLALEQGVPPQRREGEGLPPQTPDSGDADGRTDVPN